MVIPSPPDFDAIAERMVRVMEVAIVEGASRDQTLLWMRTALYRMIMHGEPLPPKREDWPWIPTELPHEVVRSIIEP